MPAKNTIANRLLAGLVQIRHYSAPADRSIPPAKQKYVPTSGTYPKGFLAGSAFAGVKASNTKYDDLALVMSETPCPATATFTQNIFKAAPVVKSRQFLVDRRSEGFRGVVVNSGCANAVTGSLGLEHATTMARETDKLFNPNVSDDATPQTLVMSTGVIGQRLPIDKITNAIPKLKENVGNTHEHWLNAAKAICTTDTFPKLLSRTFTLPSHPDTTYSIAGMTKGAGMIHPNMATLLGMICTDVKIDPTSMRTLLGRAVNSSFNCISIDGDTSTNDTVTFFANGAAAPEDVKPLYYGTTKDERDKTRRRSRTESSEDMLAMETVLTDFAQDLAKLVVRDGEGATKFVTIRVKSDTTYLNAKRAAVSIARSALVKTALYGKDANWGRILCAIGYAPGIMSSREISVSDLKIARTTREPQYSNIIKAERAVIPSRTSVSFIPADGSEELKLLVRGEPEQVDEERAKQILEMEDLEILVRLEDDGESAETTVRPNRVKEAVFWTCDFSHEYVTINGDYRT
ncbi:Arginine biosynthesis bifunctional protein ArgJ, mitochondrial [Pseudocercospora fuligena]|uniref:Arginine biosynthesis bifunctional protein ArgJ, mitochondrial n=1 Tax=Pseudocercospora fuligena TaxID=685502 RepID=A0A8H6VLP4_9PEZI|nr:Arginine biosynthesis bifunctional protein ArgJ, mitochondrial [Pseudocercospora fuligena]